MKSNSMSFFLIGISAGAAVMLLLAPKSGKETRRYVSRRADDVRELIERGSARAQDLGGDILHTTKQTVRRTNKALTSAVDAGRSAASALL
jgi:gas vesicle protein